MSKDADTFVTFHTIYTDPERDVVLPGTLAEKLATRPDYLPGLVRIATKPELKEYNAIIKDKGPEAAKAWLTEQWA